MESDLKVPQSPLSTLRSESDSSSLADRSPLRQPPPRFARSGSRSRSRSREEAREELPSRFFVKRLEQRAVSPPHPCDPALGRFLRTATAAPKREATPAKGRGSEAAGEAGGPAGRAERELEWLKLERRCQLTEA